MRFSSSKPPRPFGQSLFTAFAGAALTGALLVVACGGDTNIPATETGATSTSNSGSGQGGSTSTSLNTASATSGPDLSTVSTGGAGGTGGGMQNEGGMGMATPTWGQTYSGSGQAFVKDLAVDPSGNSVVVGAFQGSVDFGSGSPLVSTGATDVFVVKYDASGQHVWSKSFGGGSSKDQSALAVAVDSQGDIAFCGPFYGSLNFGGSNLTNNDQFSDIYVAKLSGSTGNHVFSKAFTNVVGTNDNCLGVAINTTDDVLITGKFQSEINFGGGTIAAAGGNGDTDAFVASFSKTGTFKFGNAYGGPGQNVQEEQTAVSIATSVGNDIAITGDTYGSVDFGGGTLMSGSNRRAFVATFTGSGAHKNSYVYEATDETQAGSVRYSKSGDLFVAGVFDTKITIDTEMLEASNGTQDIYIARYDANAKLLYASRFGGKETANIYDLAIDANGFALLGGEFQNDFPVNSSQTFDSQGSYDALLLNVGSLGNGYWGYAMGETGRQTVYGVDIDANGDILFAGTFSGTIDLGQGPIMGGNGDLFIAKFAP